MNIGRTRFSRDIVTEFLPPEDKKSRKVMIFCSGVPGTPNKDDVLEFFAQQGYWTFFPRYRGTWESSGIFLKQSLEEDLFDVIDALNEKFTDTWTGKSYRVRPKHVTIVGSSFGGPAAIISTLDARVDRAICISPVVDWVAEDKAEPLDDLYRILKEGYGGAYRLNKSSWNRLAKGRFYNPVNYVDDLDGRKIMIFHAKNDKVVRYKPVSKFAKGIGCQLISLDKGGHLSSSMLMRNRYYRKVSKFLKAD